VLLRKREGYLIAVCAKFDGDPVLIDLYVCPQCGKMQQFASEKTRRRLNQGTHYVDPRDMAHLVSWAMVFSIEF